MLSSSALGEKEQQTQLAQEALARAQALPAPPAPPGAELGTVEVDTRLWSPALREDVTVGKKERSRSHGSWKREPWLKSTVLALSGLDFSAWHGFPRGVGLLFQRGVGFHAGWA